MHLHFCRAKFITYIMLKAKQKMRKKKYVVGENENEVANLASVKNRSINSIPLMQLLSRIIILPFDKMLQVPFPDTPFFKTTKHPKN